MTVLFALVILEFVFIRFSYFEILPNIGIVFHTLGGVFSSILICQLFLVKLAQTDNITKLVFVIGAVSFLAMGWELFEWIFGYMLVHNQMQGTLDDTMLDLLVGVSSSLLGLIIQKFLDRALENRFFH
ncbi:MAG: hypothetical protein K2Q22_03715 [Cytophagales bacterium]|nr:hypothetical protein [Cytophagales bacterium]